MEPPGLWGVAASASRVFVSDWRRNRLHAFDVRASRLSPLASVGEDTSSAWRMSSFFLSATHTRTLRAACQIRISSFSGSD